jgi:hypothetical protein
MAMGPGNYGVTQPIGMLERNPDDRSNTSDSGAGSKCYRHDVQYVSVITCARQGSFWLLVMPVKP